MEFIITGDTHGSFHRFHFLSPEQQKDDNLGVIILGDAGWNFFLNKMDERKKKEFHQNFSFYVYCVYGNHEARPSDLVSSMTKMWDNNVEGMVWFEPSFPRIRYFMEYGEYTINGKHTLVIGGAYSVDKHYRLLKAGLAEDQNDPHTTFWWNNEQLSDEEKTAAQKLAIFNQPWDLVLSHTCPYSWEPRDLFLNMVNQSSVDDSTEKWLEKLKESINWNVWLFGHFHDDRLIRPHVEMFSTDMEELSNIFKRWEHWDIHNELSEWWLNKDPNFYMI